MYKIFIADPISESGLTVFQSNNGHFKIDARSKLSPAELKKAVADADAIIVRSETKITAEILAAFLPAPRLQAQIKLRVDISGA